MLTNWQTDLVLNAEAQSSNATTKTIDLPRDGHIAMIDLIFAMTNGSTSNTAYSDGGTAGTNPFDVITKMEVIANGSKTLLSVTSIEDLIAEAIKISGKIPARTISEEPNKVQRIHLPVYFGRFADDKLVLIPNGPHRGGNFFDSLQLKITYDMTVAATDFATGTFTVTCAVRKLVDGSLPETKLIKTFSHKESYTTVGSTEKSINLTYGPGLFMRSIQVFAYEAAIAEGVDITKLRLDYSAIGGGKVTPFENEWKTTQKHNSSTYGLPPLTFGGVAFFEDTDALNTRVPDIKDMHFVQTGAALTKTTLLSIAAETVAGDDLVMGVWASGDAAATAYATDYDIYWSVTTDVIPRYAYIDFDESQTMNDLLDLGGMTGLVLKMTDGAAGGSVRVNEEVIIRASDFRST